MSTSKHSHPNITYVARSFLDYRVPVFAALDKLTDNSLHVVYSTKWTPRRVQVKIASVLGERAIGLSGEKWLGDGNPSEANTTVCIPYQPGLLKAISKTKPDILIGDGFFQWTFAALAYKLRKKIPLVMCYERTFHTERKAQWYRTLYRKMALKFIAAMCCNGQECGDYSKWLGMPANKITYGHMVADYHGLVADANSFKDTKIQGLKNKIGAKGLVYLYVGRLIKIKGVSELLLAWSEFIYGKEDSASLIIVGDGPEREALQAACYKQHILNVHFVGAVDYDHIAPYYALADCLVMPGLEDNWSLVVPEAMACGLPVLCSKYNGCWPEMIHEGKNGWVFDPLDSKETINVLELLLKNKGQLEKMGNKSRELVSSHTPEAAAESIIEACRIAISR